MPDRMPNRMSEDMSDRMPEDVPVRTCINVMVGITRSKVFFLITNYSDPCAQTFSTLKRLKELLWGGTAHTNQDTTLHPIRFHY